MPNPYCPDCYGFMQREYCAGCKNHSRFIPYSVGLALFSEKKETIDPIDSPAHYNHGGIETIDIIRSMLTPEEFRGYLKGNILKYRERATYKGKTEEDYAKAKKYYDWLKECEAKSD